MVANDGEEKNTHDRDLDKLKEALTSTKRKIRILC